MNSELYFCAVGIPNLHTDGETGRGANTASCTMGNGFPWGKLRPGRAADDSPLLVKRSWKCTAIPLHTLWATIDL